MGKQLAFGSRPSLMCWEVLFLYNFVVLWTDVKYQLSLGDSVKILKNRECKLNMERLI